MKELYKFLVIFSFFDRSVGILKNKNIIRFCSNSIPTETDLDIWKKYIKQMLREENTDNITILGFYFISNPKVWKNLTAKI